MVDEVIEPLGDQVVQQIVEAHVDPVGGTARDAGRLEHVAEAQVLSGGVCEETFRGLE